MEMSKNFFNPTRTIYWPAEFTDISNMLKGKDSSDKITHPGMYDYNTGVLVLAAVIGLTNNREREVGSQRNEISTDTFDRQDYDKGVKLSTFIYLIALLSKQDLNLLRTENEEEVIRIFERYAAGGFEYLRGALSESSDTTGQSVLNSEVVKALKIINLDQDTGAVDIFASS